MTDLSQLDTMVMNLPRSMSAWTVTPILYLVDTMIRMAPYSTPYRILVVPYCALHTLTIRLPTVLFAQNKKEMISS
jgi:hypothetical protein